MMVFGFGTLALFHSKNPKCMRLVVASIVKLCKDEMRCGSFHHCCCPSEKLRIGCRVEVNNLPGYFSVGTKCLQSSELSFIK